MKSLRNDFTKQPDGSYKSHCGRAVIYRDTMRPNSACWLTLIDDEVAPNIFGQPRAYANPRAAAHYITELDK